MRELLYRGARDFADDVAEYSFRLVACAFWRGFSFLYSNIAQAFPLNLILRRIATMCVSAETLGCFVDARGVFPRTARAIDKEVRGDRF